MSKAKKRIMWVALLVLIGLLGGVAGGVDQFESKDK